MRDPKLWTRIESHRFDDPSAEQPFSARLAKAAGWTKAWASEAIGEYRRFVYLSQVAPGRVTPSDAVDKVWHLHMTYTRDYWEEFCGNVLGRPLHHEPAAGAVDAPRHAAQYAETLALYEAEFGRRPPPSIWPASPKASWRGALVFAVALGGAAALLWSWGWWIGSLFTAFFALASLAVAIRAAVHPEAAAGTASLGVIISSGGGDGGGDCGGGCGD